MSTESRDGGGEGGNGTGVARAVTPAPGTSLTGERAKAMVETLAGVNIFSGLPPAHLRRIAEIGTEEQHAYGATIFAEGEPGTKFYLILDGAVRISRIVPGMGEEALAILRGGKYFGEMSLIDDSPRSAHALVHEKCKLFVINKRDLEDLLFVDRDLAYELLWNFVRTLTARLRETNDKMTFLATSNKF
jgi:CRP/FNR family transcriptional regulator, cyclic AMP receptor protein